MSNPVILNHIFEECQNYTLDKFWKDMFLNCAQNKFPRGARYDPKTHNLYIKVNTTANKTKTENIELPKNSKDLYKVITNIFKERLNIFSTKDLQIKNEELDKVQKSRKLNLNCEWKKLKPRSIKEHFIMNYINKLKDKYELDAKQAKELLITVNLAFQFKKLSSSDIEYKNGEILNIKGLKYDSETNEWKITNKPKCFTKNEKSQAKEKLYQAADKFIKEHNTQRLNYNNS